VSWGCAHDPQNIGIPDATALDLFCDHAFAPHRPVVCTKALCGGYQRTNRGGQTEADAGAGSVASELLVHIQIKASVFKIHPAGGREGLRPLKASASGWPITIRKTCPSSKMRLTTKARVSNGSGGSVSGDLQIEICGMQQAKTLDSWIEDRKQEYFNI
jgi:hypothetical protein